MRLLADLLLLALAMPLGPALGGRAAFFFSSGGDEDLSFPSESPEDDDEDESEDPSLDLDNDDSFLTFFFLSSSFSVSFLFFAFSFFLADSLRSGSGGLAVTEAPLGFFFAGRSSLSLRLPLPLDSCKTTPEVRSGEARRLPESGRLSGATDRAWLRRDS